MLGFVQGVMICPDALAVQPVLPTWTLYPVGTPVDRPSIFTNL